MAKHFGYRSAMFRVYIVSCFFGLMGGSIAYFELLVRQITGLFPSLEHNQLSLQISLFIFLMVLTIATKHFKIDLKIFAIGIIGTVCLCFFFIWLILTRPSSEGFSENTPKIEAFGSDIVTFISILSSAYSLHELIAAVVIQ